MILTKTFVWSKQILASCGTSSPFFNDFSNFIQAPIVSKICENLWFSKIIKAFWKNLGYVPPYGWVKYSFYQILFKTSRKKTIRNMLFSFPILDVFFNEKYIYKLHTAWYICRLTTYIGSTYTASISFQIWWLHLHILPFAIFFFN